MGQAIGGGGRERGWWVVVTLHNCIPRYHFHVSPTMPFIRWLGGLWSEIYGPPFV